MKDQPLILVTNDDGVHAAGIIALAKALRPIGEVMVVAPDRERSAVGHSLTLHRPLSCELIREGVYAVNGTPTDCVAIAVKRVLPRRPALVVSGINRGGNLGDDITYSGTVSAALEGTLLGIHSVAVSLDGDSHLHFGDAGKIGARIASFVLENGLPEDTLLNVNVPNRPLSEVKGIRVTRQGRRTYDGDIRTVEDPRGRTHYWQGGGQPVWSGGIETDIHAVMEGFVSVMPVHYDLTNYEALDTLRSSFSLMDLNG